MKIKKALILILAAFIMLAANIFAEPKINSVTMNPANPFFGDTVTVTIDYCSELYDDCQMALAISSKPEKVNASLSGQGQIFVISEKGVDVATARPAAAPGGDIDYLANTPNGWMASTPCMDCMNEGGQSYVKEFVIHIPDKGMYPECNVSEMYLHLVMKNFALRESDWDIAADCSSESLTWTPAVPPPDMNITMKSEGILRKAGDLVMFNADYSYTNGALSAAIPLPGVGNLELVSYGPVSITGGSVNAPAIGVTSGTITWQFSDITGTIDKKEGKVWVVMKMTADAPVGINYSCAVTGSMAGISDEMSSTSVMVNPIEERTLTVSTNPANVYNGEMLTYTINYDLSGGIELGAIRTFEDTPLGTYTATPPTGWSFMPYNGTNGTWYVEDACNTGNRVIRGDALNTQYPMLLIDDNNNYCDSIIYSDFKIGFGTAEYMGSDAMIMIRHNGINGIGSKSYALLVSVDTAPAGMLQFQRCEESCSWPAYTNAVDITINKWYTAKISAAKDGSLSAKVWPKGEPEPVGWSLTWTDPSPMECDSLWKPGIGEQSGDSGDTQDSYDNFVAYGKTAMTSGAIWDTLPSQFDLVSASAGYSVDVTGPVVISWDMTGADSAGNKEIVVRAISTPCEMMVSNTVNYTYTGVTGGAFTINDTYFYCTTKEPSATSTITITPSVVLTQTSTMTATRTITINPSAVLTMTPTKTSTQTATSTVTHNLSASYTATKTPSPTVTITASVDLSATSTLTPVSTVPADSFPGDDIIINPLPGDNGGKGSCVDNNGNLIVIALEWDDNCTCYVTVLYRYLPDGSIDTSFGNNGRMVCPGPSTKYVWGDSITVKCDSSGNIIVAGTVDPCGGTCSYGIIYRFLPDGTPDTSFNAGQCFRTYGSGNDYFYDFDIDSNGRYVCVGKSWNGTDYDACVTRINPDSNPDTTFGPLGCRKIHNQAGGNGNDCALTIKCIGTEILVSGWSDSNDPGCTGTCRAMCMWKFLNDGSLDSTFGTGGCTSYINTALNHKNCVPKSMIITVGGKIVISGYVDDGSGCTLTCRSSITIVLNADGTFDTGFDSDGILTAGPGEEIRSIIEVDGKLVILYVRHNGSDTDCVVRRYDMYGTIDTTFGTAGEWVYDSGYDDECYSILRLTICRLLVTGHTASLTTGYDQVIWNIEDMCPPHTPTSTITLTAVLSPTLTMTPTITVSPTSTITKTATTTITATASSTRTVTCTATQTSTVTLTITPTFTPTMTITAQPTLTSTPLPCDGVTPPSFTVKMIFNPEHTDNIYFEITSNVLLVNPPSIDVYPHGGTENKDVLSFVSTLVPGQDRVYRVLYPKQTGFGDIDRIVVKGQDICGVWGTSSGKFDKEVISEKDIKIFNNVIEPDKGERVTIMFNVYSGDNVKVKVYTRTGVLVATLFDGVITQVGTKELYWEGKNDNGNIINSGTYLITVETSHYKATEKVAVVR
ncbi:MAG: hypothetical protein JXR81_00840 [Candidatus Goldbacteria bacterium]|nr:hypothetical protein [Candidatus Goldiibacteriota bacterium]